MNRWWTLGLCLLWATAAAAQAQPPSSMPPLPPQGEWRTATPVERALDTAAFKGADRVLAEQLTDVQSAVVVLGGRVVYEFHRDGEPGRLRHTQSVAKSALSALVGIAIGQGRIKGLDQKVVELVPEWGSLNSDPRAAAITVRHLVSQTTGFAVNDPSGTAAALAPAQAWARPLASAPGQSFAYDNSVVPLAMAVLEKATGMPLAEYARRQLVTPLGMAEPSYDRGLHLRTADMARLGQLYLQKGSWAGQQLLPESYVMDSTRPHSAGGPPVSLPHGYLWWVIPSPAERPTFMASGYSGQFIWVHPALDLVVATTSSVSPDVQQRGQALQLIRTHLFAAARQRVASDVK